MNKHFLLTILTVVVIIAATAVAVLLAKGYSFSPKEGRVVGSGILSATSVPDGASVYIDGHLTTATNTTVSGLVPKKYKIRIIKEGFIGWEKEVDVAEGLVAEVKATLFPAIPTVYPLTFNGVTKAILSPDGQKLAFLVPIISDQHPKQKGGIWVWTMTSAPISFNRGAEPHQIVASDSSLDFSQAALRWSPDSKEILATLQEAAKEGEAYQRNYLLPVDQQTSLRDLKDITPLVTSTLKGWADDQKTKDEARMLTIKDLSVQKEASGAAVVRWSPDETKLIIGPKTSFPNANPTPTITLLHGFRVYDLESLSMVTNISVTPAKNQQQQPKVYELPEAKDYLWLPDSRHIILVLEDKIAISDFDGSNVAVIYAGKFTPFEVFPWPDSSRLVLVTSFPIPTASTPNLFGVNLK